MSSVGGSTQTENEHELAEAKAKKRLDSNERQYIYLTYTIAFLFYLSLIILVNLATHRVYGIELSDFLVWYPAVMAVAWLVSFGPTVIALRLMKRTLAAQRDLLQLQHSKE